MITLKATLLSWTSGIYRVFYPETKDNNNKALFQDDNTIITELIYLAILRQKA